MGTQQLLLDDLAADGSMLRLTLHNAAANTRTALAFALEPGAPAGGP